MGVGKRLWRQTVSFADKKLMNYRRKKLNNEDFSIICNNCWGGYVYRRYGLPYLTPTVGCFFFAEDYIKLCGNVAHYMGCELEFIDYTQSVHRESLRTEKLKSIPIARLGDIEVFFMHYASEEEAREKWERRKTRINYNNLIFKFSAMNDFSESHLDAFDQLDVNKKFCFLPYRSAHASAIYFPTGKKNAVKMSDDTSEYSRYINIDKMINAKYVCGKNMR